MIFPPLCSSVEAKKSELNLNAAQIMSHTECSIAMLDAGLATRRYSSQFKNNCFTDTCSDSEEGSDVRLIYCVSLNSRFESNEGEERTRRSSAELHMMNANPRAERNTEPSSNRTGCSGTEVGDSEVWFGVPTPWRLRV